MTRSNPDKAKAVPPGNNTQKVGALLAAVNTAFAGGHSHQAMELAGQAVQQFPRAADTWILRGRLNFHRAHLLAARRDFEQACQLRPEDQQLIKELSMVLEQLDAYADLQELFGQAIERWPLDDDLRMARSRIATQLGDFETARADFLQVLARQPDHVGAICSMVARGFGDEVGGLDGLETCLASHKTGSVEHYSLCYAQARLLEQDHRYTEAFEAYRRANSLQAAAGGMQITAKQRGARAVIDDLTADLIDRYSGRGHPSDRPVFIIGMPRSGTSLTEQILGAHPDIYAAGEQGFWPDVLRALFTGAPRQGGSMVAAIDSIGPQVWKQPGAEYLRRMAELNVESVRTTDKLPVNFALIPYIRLIFPNARIIHLRREPLATLASCIRTNFSVSMFAWSVEDWARYYGVYQALMDHWRPILGAQLLEIDYEELVRDLPTQARRLVAFLGLDWHEACLHPERSKRAVRTASVDQVRRSVYTGAIAKWRHYEAELEALRPLIEESRASLTPGRASVNSV